MVPAFIVPTILMTEHSSRLRTTLVQLLEHQGYLVLQAQDEDEALQIARVHSRPIQLMLATESLDDRTLAAKIKMYRPGMDVLFLAHGLNGENPDLTAPEMAKVQSILKSSYEIEAAFVNPSSTVSRSSVS